MSQEEDTELLDNVSICLPLSWKDGKYGIRIAQALSERGARVFAFAASSAEAMDFAAKVNKATNRQGVVGLRCDQLKSLNVTYNAVITDGSFYIPDGNFKGGNKGGLFNNLERLIKVEKENRRLIDENSRLRNNIFDQQEQLTDKTTEQQNQKDAAAEQAMNNFDALEHVSNAGKTEYAEDFGRLRKEKEEWEEKCRRLHDVLLQEESAKMDRALVDAKDAQARKRQVERILTCPGPSVCTIEEEPTLGDYEVNRKDPEQAPEAPEDNASNLVSQQHVQVQVASQPYHRHCHPPNVLTARLPFPRCSPVPQTCIGRGPNPQGRQSPFATPRTVICRPKPSPLPQNRIVRSISCSADPPNTNNDAVRSVNTVSVVKCTQGPRFQRSPLGVNRDALAYHGSWAALPGQNAASSSTSGPTRAQLPAFSPSPRLLNVKLPMMVPWAWPQA
eukprot:GEMP01011130.1.p1 GENE.GEMP01011130.1~~GEMP01011130.1.p1  ORF type:complete len:461 (+),score=95.51 GEMP01011130.1:46-1383(+)